MKGETIAWVIMGVAVIADFFIPNTRGWNNLWWVMAGGSAGYLLVKHAVKEALDEKQ